LKRKNRRADREICWSMSMHILPQSNPHHRKGNAHEKHPIPNGGRKLPLLSVASCCQELLLLLPFLNLGVLLLLLLSFLKFGILLLLLFLLVAVARSA